MNLNNAFITAVRALSRNKMRSSLTSIGIIIGISSVIIMVGLGNSAQIVVKDKMYTYGTNAMKIETNHKYPFAKSDLDFLKKTFYQIKYITPIVQDTSALAKYKNKHSRVRLFGVGKDFLNIKNRKIAKGRFFNEDEIYSMAKVAVIAPTNQKKLFGLKDPIGEQIVVNGLPLKVIGILEEAGQAFSGTDFDNILVIPYSTFTVRIYNQKIFHQMYISTHNGKLVESTKELLDSYYRKKFAIPSKVESDIKIFTSKDKLKMANDISNALAILLAGIASISLFVGGIGIMNIMLVSVTERTREIGIRMAIGAKKRDILVQFLIESATLSSIGGIIGILLGLGIYLTIIIFVEWPFLFSPLSTFISVLFSAAVGIFFGYYPARKAANLKPIEALKYE